MLRLLTSLTVASTLLLGSATAVACGGHSNETQAAQEYETRGTVRAIDLGNRTVTIQHEDVPGYMPAMTMPFELANVGQATGIAVGDRVTFKFRPEAGGRHVLVSLTKLP